MTPKFIHIYLPKCLNIIIDEEHIGFLKGCYIGNNIRLIHDLIDYRYFISDDSLILLIVCYKAFDTAEHFSQIFWPLYVFQKAIQTLYNGCNSSVQLFHGTCLRFNMGHGIRQGRPISPLLFFYFY